MLTTKQLVYSFVNFSSNSNGRYKHAIFSNSCCYHSSSAEDKKQLVFRINTMEANRFTVFSNLRRRALLALSICIHDSFPIKEYHECGLCLVFFSSSRANEQNIE